MSQRGNPAAAPSAAGVGVDLCAEARSSTPSLRPYQFDVIARFDAAVAAGHRRVLIVMPTGSGKTVVVADIIRTAARRGQRILFLAHRRELIGQASRRLYAVGVEHGVMLPGFPPRPSERVQVASIATLHARAMRSRSIEMPDADLVIIDEAHHARARTYRRVLDAYPQAAVIGLTATPCRGDGRGLGKCFDTLIEGPQVAELTAVGHLVPTRIYAPSQPDLSGIRVERGDYVESQLAARVNTDGLVGDIVAHWHRLADRRRTVVFATGVAHSLHLRDEFRRAGVLAEHIDGTTPAAERDAILSRLETGQVELVSNAMVLTEGWDQPAVSCLVLARPTKSLGLFRQMVGRVLRPAPGKADALILDHAGAVFAHGLPDDQINWTLADDRRAENSTHAARGGYGGPPALTDCPECHAIRRQGQPCPACGWQPRRKAASVEVVDGDLAVVDRTRRTVTGEGIFEPRAFYAQLLTIAQERGYQKGWAAHKYREKFGSWPAWKYLPALPSDDAVRAWVRSRQIAFAKAQAKARGAA